MPPAPGQPYPAQQPVLAPPPRPDRRARTVLIAAAASVSALIVIVAANNQSVTDWVVRKATPHPNSFLANVGLASQAFRWRLSSNISDSLAADFTRDLVLVVLTGLLVAAVVRGAVTFGRAFWGTWMAVIVAAQVGAVASAFVVPAVKLPAGHSATQRLFVPNPYAPGPYVFIGAVGLGLVVAVITAVVAVTTRKPAPPAAGLAAPPALAGGWPEPIPVQPPPAMPEPPPWTPAPSYRDPAAAPAAPAWTSESAETAALPTEVLPAAAPRWGEDETRVVHWSQETNPLPKWEAPAHDDLADAHTTQLPAVEADQPDSRVRIDEHDEHDGGGDEDTYPPAPQAER